MKDKIRIRTYNVRFGDAILVTIPDRNPETSKTTLRNILIDVGNALNGPGGDDNVFKFVIDDVLKELNGKPLDLYVMTHEHLDHVQGLYYTAAKHYPYLKEKLAVDYAWLTASAHPDYYTNHPNAKGKKDLYSDCYQKIQNHLNAFAQADSDAFKTFLDINNPRQTDQCVDFLRNLANPEKTFYVYRGLSLSKKHPFKEPRFEILAPEEDTSDYYHPLTPMALSGNGNIQLGVNSANSYQPPAGVDAGAFYDLVEWRKNGFVDNILAIDRAANNTSVVFSIEWRKKRLLFCGDAELASWKKMHQQGLLKSVDYLKVSHHGSHNGTPNDEILEYFFPKTRSKTKSRHAGISVWDNTYKGIPHEATNDRLCKRCNLRSTLDNRNSSYFDIEISEG